MKQNSQTSFVFREHGGRRKGAGRPRTLEESFSHEARERIDERTPMHITMKFREGVPDLRDPKFLQKFTEAVERAAEKGLRIQHFSIQTNHIHVVAETDDNEILRVGMCSLLASVTWALRKLFGYWGDVFAGPYHLCAIRVPKYMKHVLKYVLFNRDHHCGESAFADVYSSVFAFGFADTLVGRTNLGVRPRWQPLIDGCLSEARSWMQRVGWRRACR